MTCDCCKRVLGGDSGYDAFTTLVIAACCGRCSTYTEIEDVSPALADALRRWRAVPAEERAEVSRRYRHGIKTSKGGRDGDG